MALHPERTLIENDLLTWVTCPKLGFDCFVNAFQIAHRHLGRISDSSDCTAAIAGLKVATPPRRGIAFCGNSVMMKSKPAASTFQKPVRRVVGGKYENAQMRLRSDAHGAAPERSRFGPLHDQSRSWIPRARGRRVAVLESYAVLGIITLPITPRPCRAR